MGAAPVCHVSVDEVLTQPPARKLAYIPPATDLQSALRAIEALRQNILVLTGQLAAQRPTIAFFSQGGAAGTGSQVAGARPSNSKPGSNPDQGRWIEQSRTTEVKRITNPDDESQFVDVQQINRLTMQDTVTGELWVFTGGK